jgi:hypothetical protein
MAGSLRPTGSHRQCREVSKLVSGGGCRHRPGEAHSSRMERSTPVSGPRLGERVRGVARRERACPRQHDPETEERQPGLPDLSLRTELPGECSEARRRRQQVVAAAWCRRCRAPGPIGRGGQQGGCHQESGYQDGKHANQEPWKPSTLHNSSLRLPAHHRLGQKHRGRPAGPPPTIPYDRLTVARTSARYSIGSSTPTRPRRSPTALRRTGIQPHANGSSVTLHHGTLEWPADPGADRRSGLGPRRPRRPLRRVPGRTRRQLATAERLKGPVSSQVVPPGTAI